MIQLGSNSADKVSRDTMMKIALFAIIAIVPIVLILRCHSERKDISVVNGYYCSSYCKDILILNGVITDDGGQIPFKLIVMKFGLTAYPVKPIGDFYVSDTSSSEGRSPNPLLFNDENAPNSFRIVDSERHENLFTRK